MKFKRYIFCAVLFGCGENVSAANDTAIVKWGAGEIVMSQGLNDESWGRAKYRNSTISFDLSLEGDGRSFVLPYSSGVDPYYKLDIGPLGLAADFQCLYIDMTSGCITKQAYGSLCAEANPEAPGDIDPRRKGALATADVNALKSLNGARTEAVCGVVLGGDNSPRAIKSIAVSSAAKKNTGPQVKK